MFGSRLMLNIRGPRLTYGISRLTFRPILERSFISVATQTACDSVKACAELFLEEIDRG
ncbi:hypothetical protein [Duncaniella muris]|uniref:hypothetical protein n=1 Tax=Duncaniella muris TaxID=2094150 RepID=UPI003F6717BC